MNGIWPHELWLFIGFLYGATRYTINEDRVDSFQEVGSMIFIMFIFLDITTVRNINLNHWTRQGTKHECEIATVCLYISTIRMLGLFHSSLFYCHINIVGKHTWGAVEISLMA